MKCNSSNNHDLENLQDPKIAAIFKTKLAGKFRTSGLLFKMSKRMLGKDNSFALSLIVIGKGSRLVKKMKALMIVQVDILPPTFLLIAAHVSCDQGNDREVELLYL